MSSVSLIDNDGRIVFQGTQSGGGGSVPFGTQAGSGSPKSSVTPTAVGSLYVDTDRGSLYIALGATSADWVAVGGNGSQDEPGVYVQTGGQLYLLSLASKVAALTDMGANDGTGNGIYWNNNHGADGTQCLDIITGSTGQFIRRLQDNNGRAVIVPVTADPHIVGALWNNAGTLAISAG